MEHSRLTPNYYFASTETGVAQMAKGAELGIWFMHSESILQRLDHLTDTWLCGIENLCRITE